MKNEIYFDWANRYRPNSVSECILPKEIKDRFQSYVNEKNIPNLILNGPPGIGKTSIAMAMMEEIDADFIKINSSLKKGIDVIRNEIMDFASSASFKDGRKYIILDEGDGILKSSQEALKSFIEEFASNAGFIITCNHKDRLDSAIFSRFATIDFKIKNDDISTLGLDFYNSCIKILEEEEITFDKKILSKVIKKYFPDFRKTLVELQAYSMKNKSIDIGILGNSFDDSLNVLVNLLRTKDWPEIRKWVGENYNSVNDFNVFARNLLNSIKNNVLPACIQSYVVLYNEYDYKQAFVVDKEINTVAFLTEIMSSMVWKE